MNLDPEQGAAVCATGHVLVSACPGSGKTRVLSKRGSWLLSSGPGRLAAVSFTRDSASELRHRILQEAGEGASKRVLTGTFHSLAIKQLKTQKDGKDKSVRILNGGETFMLMRRAFGSVNPQDIKFDEAKAAIERAKSDPDWIAGEDSASLVVNAYNRLLRQSGGLDFADLLLYCVHGMRRGTINPLNVVWMLVDEAQDMDLVQYAWIQEHAKAGVDVTMVGDDDQCHPAGVQVAFSDGERPIETLKSGESEVLGLKMGANGTAGSLRGDAAELISKFGRLRHRIDRISEREYAGDLVIVEAGGHRLPCTPEHRCLVRWTAEQVEGAHAVLLYRCGADYTLGTSAMLTKGSGFAPTSRLRRVGDDAIWVIEVVPDRKRADIIERGLSLRTGLPRERRNGEGAPVDESVVRGLLGRYGRSLDWPFATRGDRRKRGVRRPFICEAVNVIPGFMEMLVRDAGGAGLRWAPVASARREPFNGPVYSLKVTPRPFYCANGIVTHNSIYGFRHALGYDGMMRFMRDHSADHLILKRNYRCAPEILQRADRVITHNAQRVPKSMVAMRDSGGVIEVLLCAERTDESMKVVERVRADPNSWAVMARTNAMLGFIEITLGINEIPFYRMGSGSVWDSGGPSVLLALLRSLTQNDASGLTLGLVYAGIVDDLLLDRAQVDASVPVDDAFARLRRCFAEEASVSDKGRSGMRSIEQMWTEWRNALRKNRVELVIMGVSNWLQEYAGDNDKRLLAWSAISLAGLEGSLAARIAAVAHRGQREQPKEGVALLSMHGSKGLEFERVWIAGVEEGLIPHSDGELDEERRLFYVGLTRAKRELVLSYTLGDDKNQVRPSRFMKEAGLLHE